MSSSSNRPCASVSFPLFLRFLRSFLLSFFRFRSRRLRASPRRRRRRRRRVPSRTSSSPPCGLESASSPRAGFNTRARKLSKSSAVARAPDVRAAPRALEPSRLFLHRRLVAPSPRRRSDQSSTPRSKSRIASAYIPRFARHAPRAAYALTCSRIELQRAARSTAPPRPIAPRASPARPPSRSRAPIRRALSPSRAP